MTDRQNAKLNMAKRVSETLKRYENVYRRIPPIVDTVLELNDCIKNIHELQTEREKINLPASTFEKRTAEKQMIDPCVKISNALYVIGFMSKNKDLITIQELTENSLYSLSGNAALAQAKKVLDLARKYSSDLKIYGIMDDEINAMQIAIETFSAVIAKPMDTIGEKKQKTTNIAQLFAKIDSILYDKLDKMLAILKNTSPDFYDEYRTARNFILTSTRKRKPNEDEDKPEN